MGMFFRWKGFDYVGIIEKDFRVIGDYKLSIRK